MPAGIREGAQRARLVAQEDDRAGDGVHRPIVAGRLHLVDAADEEPLAEMDVLHLGAVEFRGDIGGTRQAARRHGARRPGHDFFLMFQKTGTGGEAAHSERSTVLR